MGSAHFTPRRTAGSRGTASRRFAPHRGVIGAPVKRRDRLRRPFQGVEAVPRNPPPGPANRFGSLRSGHMAVPLPPMVGATEKALTSKEPLYNLSPSVTLKWWIGLPRVWFVMVLAYKL